MVFRRHYKHLTRFQFNSLLEELLTHGLINSSTVTTARRYIKMNNDWLEVSDVPIKDSLHDYYGGAAANRKSSFLLMAVTLSLSILGPRTMSLFGMIVS